MATVFNIQRFSIQDGPGVRTTVFFKGCPLRCIWCSNPESQSRSPEISYSRSICKKCGRCVEACDTHAITINNNMVSIDRKTCLGCGKCAEVCTTKSLKLFGKEMTVEEVFEEVSRDKPFYNNSGGGVTASGGEALLQADFVAQLFKRCQDTYIHTCLDTCGYANTGAWEKVLPFTNLILFDVKLFNSFDHRRMTGRSNQKILRSLELVAKSEVPTIIRIPIIPRINDSAENITSIAQYISGLRTIKEINLLPYHRFGISKYSMLNRNYCLSELHSPEHPALEEICATFESFDFNCKVII